MISSLPDPGPERKREAFSSFIVNPKIFLYHAAISLELLLFGYKPACSKPKKLVCFDAF
jgi:hypothetical protein